MAYRVDALKDKDFLMKHRDKISGKSLMQVLLESSSGNPISKHINSSDDKKRVNKYGNKKIFREDKLWHSVWEYECYLILKDIKEVTSIKTQVEYKFIHNQVYITKYVADFVFEYCGHEIVADAKSEHTATMQRFKIQQKLMRAFYNCEIINFYKGKTDISELLKSLYTP